MERKPNHISNLNPIPIRVQGTHASQEIEHFNSSSVFPDGKQTESPFTGCSFVTMNPLSSDSPCVNSPIPPGISSGTKRIALLFGGCSPEYGVSLHSAHAVACCLDRERYEPVLVGITRQGDWFLYRGKESKIEDDTWSEDENRIPVSLSLNRSDHALLLLGKGRAEKLPIDAAFPILHGINGEDGTVQGALKLAGIPVVGCGVLSSALCMDKDRAHRLVQAAGIPVPRSQLIGRHTTQEQILDLAEGIGWPVFVKPVKSGSSFGITKVSCPQALSDAVKLAFSYDDTILLEESISGFEVGCAILGNDKLTIGAVDEIELSEGFFDFTEKYTLKTSAIHVPARIDERTAERIRQTGIRIYRALSCHGFARVDMFLADSGEIYFNEVNTIPGFTAHSRFPGMLAAAGQSLSQIITTAIELSLENAAVYRKAGN